MHEYKGFSWSRLVLWSRVTWGNGGMDGRRNTATILQRDTGKFADDPEGPRSLGGQKARCCFQRMLRPTQAVSRSSWRVLHWLWCCLRQVLRLTGNAPDLALPLAELSALPALRELHVDW